MPTMFLSVILLSALAFVPSAGKAERTQTIALGPATATLSGPWRFHAGDDPAWASTNFDDEQWEQVDLTAPAGSHDSDVGLSGYVDGWGARGHHGMSGYGWYRIHLHLVSPENLPLSITGPPAVDSSYQMFWNGKLLGGIGDFIKSTPRVFSIQPRVFAIPHEPSTVGDGTDVLAVRVWMAPWDLADPQGGGIRIAPTLGISGAVQGVYQSEWIETLRGYVVEIVEALGFASLCLVVWLLSRFNGDAKRYRWLYAASLLTGGYRLNQAVFFWGRFESVPAFEMISLTFLYPLGLAAWTMAWANLIGFKNSRWLKMFFGITALYFGSSFIQHGVFYGSAHPPITSAVDVLITGCRLFYLASTCWLLYKLLTSKTSHRWLLGVMIFLISVGQFASELSRLGVPGIWFPFETGVSRGQFAYALFFVFAVLFLCECLSDSASSRGNQGTRH